MLQKAGYKGEKIVILANKRSSVPSFNTAVIAQAMMQAGGEEWKHYNELFRDEILKHQGEDGVWRAPGSGNDLHLHGKNTLNGKIYRNAICTLMLEVYYRFLATGGGGGHGI